MIVAGIDTKSSSTQMDGVSIIQFWRWVWRDLQHAGRAHQLPARTIKIDSQRFKQDHRWTISRTRPRVILWSALFKLLYTQPGSVCRSALHHRQLYAILTVWFADVKRNTSSRGFHWPCAIRGDRRSGFFGLESFTDLRCPEGPEDHFEARSSPSGRLPAGPGFPPLAAITPACCARFRSGRNPVRARLQGTNGQPPRHYHCWATPPMR